MVKDLYPRMGFRQIDEAPDRRVFELDIKDFLPFVTHINVLSHAYESSQRP